jgi:hypothetical protein
LAVGGLRLSVAGVGGVTFVVVMCGVGVRAGQPGLPRPSGYCSKPGDMMMDWEPPPAGVRPLSLWRPSAVPLGGCGLTAEWRELAAWCPIGTSDCPCVRIIDNLQ